MKGVRERTGDDQRLEPLIFAVRGQRVILDADLAQVYGVQTKALNQAIKRNASRFPVDFAFQVTAEELVNLKSHSVTSSLISTKDQRDIENRSLSTAR